MKKNFSNFVTMFVLCSMFTFGSVVMASAISSIEETKRQIDRLDQEEGLEEYQQRTLSDATELMKKAGAFSNGDIDSLLIKAQAEKRLGLFQAAIDTLSKIIEKKESLDEKLKKDIMPRIYIERADAFIKIHTKINNKDERFPQTTKNAKDPEDISKAIKDLNVAKIELENKIRGNNLIGETIKEERCNIDFLFGLANWIKFLTDKKEENKKSALDGFEQASDKYSCKRTAQYSKFWIAQILASDRKYNAMLNYLNSATDTSLPDADLEFAEKIKPVIEKWKKDLNPWHASISVGGTVDSNVVAKPDQNIDGLDVSHKSDYALITTATMRYQPHFDSGFIFAAQYDFYSSVYSKLYRYNTIGNSIGVTVGQELIKDKLTALVQTSYSYFYMNKHSYMSLITVRPMLDLTLYTDEKTNNKVKLFGGAGFSHRNMMNQIYAPEENRDANIPSIFTGISYIFSNGNGYVSARGEFAKERTEGVNWDSSWSKLSIDAFIPFSLFADGSVANDLGIILGLDYIDQPFKYTHTFFETKRHDKGIYGTLGLAYKISKSLEARLTYTASNIKSNIDLYKYHRNLLYFGLTFNM